MVGYSTEYSIYSTGNACALRCWRDGRRLARTWPTSFRFSDADCGDRPDIQGSGIIKLEMRHPLAAK